MINPSLKCRYVHYDENCLRKKTRFGQFPRYQFSEEYKINSSSGSAGPYQGRWQRQHGGGTTGKLEVWEGGHRVPGVVSWPSMIPSNTVSEALVSSMDILPTVARLLNATLPSDRGFDGMDLTDVISGTSLRAHEVHGCFIQWWIFPELAFSGHQVTPDKDKEKAEIIDPPNLFCK